MGTRRAGTSDSLWWLCQRPGGVTKAPPGSQSTRTGSMIEPDASSLLADEGEAASPDRR